MTTLVTSLLQKLNLPSDKASVFVNENKAPSELTVVVYEQSGQLRELDTWEGHPVQFIYTSEKPVLHA